MTLTAILGVGAGLLLAACGGLFYLVVKGPDLAYSARVINRWLFPRVAPYHLSASEQVRIQTEAERERYAHLTSAQRAQQQQFEAHRNLALKAIAEDGVALGRKR